MAKPAPYLLFVAAEPSGDQHAAHVVRAVREARPEIEIEAFGGPALRAAGCVLHEDLMQRASMVVSFLRSLGYYFSILRRFDGLLARRPPSAVVLVDSPGLNFLLARLARWRRVPVVYYICPQIWAWAPWRRSKVLRWTDLLLTILPFEEELYRDGPVPVRHVGHPLADELAPYPADAGEQFRRQRGIASGEKIIGLFPGSREQEVEGLSGVFARLVRRMELDGQPVRVLASCYRPGYQRLIESAGRRHGVAVETVGGDARQLMMACDLAIVASGTASLELAYFEKPMLVLYRTNRLGRWLFEFFRVTPWIALPNIIGSSLQGSEPTVVEKLFSSDPSLELAPVARALLDDGEERSRAIDRLRRLKEVALQPGGVRTAAQALLEFVAERERPGDGAGG